MIKHEKKGMFLFFSQKKISNINLKFFHPYRELHMKLHPGWTAKDNYAINGKRKKKKRERNADGGMRYLI